MTGPASSASLSLDELAALADEISAVVRASLPLEPALRDLGRELPGRLGRALRGLAERVSRGQSLADALAAEDGLPPAYQAVVAAGFAAGRLPSAFESLSQTARRLAEVEQAVTAAVVYPIAVVLTAYTFAVGFLTLLAPYFRRFGESLDPKLGAWLERLSALGESAPWWAGVAPLLLAGLLAGLAAGRGALWGGGWQARLWRMLPGVGRLLAASRTANLCEVLTLLVENGVPLPQALTLAAQAAGDARLAAAAEEMARAAERGESVFQALSAGSKTTNDKGPGDSPSLGLVRAALPRFLTWLVLHGSLQGRLADSLRHAAAIYRERALWQADLVRHWGGLLLTIVLGGTAVAIFGLLVFVPLTSILENILRD